MVVVVMLLCAAPGPYLDVIRMWASNNLTSVTGHSIRIGGMIHLLLLGVDPFALMAQGHWESSAFLEYWWLCEKIIPTFIDISLSSKPLCCPQFPTSKIAYLSPYDYRDSVWR